MLLQKKVINKLKKTNFKVYMLLADGDSNMATFLKQIVYWHLPNKKGQTKLTIIRDNEVWLAKKDTDWFGECGLSFKQIRKIKKEAIDQELIKINLWMFIGIKMTHFAITKKLEIKLNQCCDYIIEHKKEANSKSEIKKILKSEEFLTGKKQEVRLPHQGQTQIAPKGQTQLPPQGHPLNNSITSAIFSENTFSSLQEDGVSDETHFVGNESLIKGDVVNEHNNTQSNIVEQKDNVEHNNTQSNIVESSLEISGRLKNKSTKKNKPTKKIKQKYKHNNIVEKCYVQAVNAKATNHKRDKEGKLTQQAGIDTLDKIYALLNPKIQNPYYYANNVTEEYIDREWKSSEVIESFKFHMEHSTKDKQIRNFGNFILTTNYRERKSWSPLIIWHAQMKKGITGTLDKDGEYFFKILNQNKVRDLDTLSAQTVNRIAKELNTLKESYELFEGTEHNMTYPSGIISVAAKYIKEKTNNTQYELVWINGKKFLPDFLKDTIKLNILKKKSKTRSRDFA